MLNIIGKKKKKELTTFLKSIDQFKKEESPILIETIAFNYQKFMDMETRAALVDEAQDVFFKLSNLSLKYSTAYYNGLKLIGAGATARLKFKEPEPEEDNSIFKTIADARKQMI